MRLKPHLSDYDSLVKPGSYEVSGAESDTEGWSDLGREKSGCGSDEEKAVKWIRKNSSSPQRLEAADNFSFGQTPLASTRQAKSTERAVGTISNQAKANENSLAQKSSDNHWILKRGHALTYAALFLFTIILYARPAEFYPSRWTASIAFIIGVITLAVFVPSQLSIEGTLTARPREVNLVLMLCVTGLLSIPLAISPAVAWVTFTDTFIRCVVIFIVMVNVVRTEARLKGLLFLVVGVSCWLSLGALNDFRLGLLTIEGYRVAGVGNGIFGNSNDMALHLVTIAPIAVALAFAMGGVVRKMLFGACAALMMAAIVVTYSRAAFLGSIVMLGFLAWKLGNRHRVTILLLGIVVLVLFLALAPANYAVRILSIFVPSLDPVGSADARRGELFRSLLVAARHPLFGIGMGNYAAEMSYRGLVTHNSYTQVAAEMGMAALTLYTMFIITPLKRLGHVARETFAARSNSPYYYLAIGLQASLLAYIVTTFFLSVAYLWYGYYLVAYAVCLRRMYESDTGRLVVLKKQQHKKNEPGDRRVASLAGRESEA